MKIKKIRRIIREQLSGKSSGNSLLAVSTGFPVFQQYMQDAMQAGRETDADAIVIFIISGDSINIALFAGRTMLLGDGIREYLSEYHDGVEAHTTHCIEWLVDSAVDGLKSDDKFFAVLRDNETDKWRGFRGEKPMTLDEIKANDKMALH